MTRRVMALALLVTLNGCIGPQFLKVQRYKYNEAIQESTAEQLLLNIVRLRYNDSPMFLNVGDIDAKFTLESSADASATIMENVGAAPLNANSATVAASSGFTNNPNIKLSPMQDADFARLLKPLTPHEMLALGKRRVYVYEYLALTMQSYTYPPDPKDGDTDKAEDGDENEKKKEETVDASRDPSKWKTFLERLKDADKNGHIVLESEIVETEELLPSYLACEIEPGDVIEAKLAGLMFKKKKKPKEQKPNEQRPEKQKPKNKKDEEEYVLVGKTREWTMKVPRSVVYLDMPSLQEAQEAQELVRDLRSQLREETESSLRLLTAAELQKAEQKFQKMSKTLSKQPVAFRFAPKEKDGGEAEINVRSRSIVQMMSFLSHGVDVPSTHKDEVTHKNEGKKEQDQPGIPGFKVEHQVRRPSDAFVSVKYRGHWFYIKREDKDSNSKKFLSVLTELFVERAGKAATTPTILPL